MLGNGRAGDQTTCRSLIHGSTSSAATSPSVDPLVVAVQSRLARSPRPLGIECPQCVGQRPHGRARWRAAPDHKPTLGLLSDSRPSFHQAEVCGLSAGHACCAVVRLAVAMQVMLMAARPHLTVNRPAYAFAAGAHGLQPLVSIQQADAEGTQARGGRFHRNVTPLSRSLPRLCL